MELIDNTTQTKTQTASDEYFASKASEVLLPTEEGVDHSYDKFLDDVDIGKEVSKNRIETVVIRETDTIKYPMICVRADKVGNVKAYTIEGLRCLIESCAYTEHDKQEGIINDTLNVYMYTATKMLECGRASYNKLYRYLDTYIKNAISDRMSVWLFTDEKTKVRIDKLDPARVRLDI